MRNLILGILLLCSGYSYAANKAILADETSGQVQNFTNVQFIVSGTSSNGNVFVSSNLTIGTSGTVTLGGETRTNWPTGGAGGDVFAASNNVLAGSNTITGKLMTGTNLYVGVVPTQVVGILTTPLGSTDAGTLNGLTSSQFIQTSLFDSTFFHVTLLASTYNITNSAYVIYKWDTEISDLGNAFSANAYTCHSSGYYEFHFQGGGISVATNGGVITAIYTNGLGWYYAYGALSPLPSGLGQTRVPCYATGYLSSGVVVSAWAYLAGDAGPRQMSYTTGSGQFPVYFTGRRIR